MKDSKKLFKIFYIVAASGILLSILLALFFGGFAISAVKVSNAMFVIAMLLCITGAVWFLLPFMSLKGKLRRTPMHMQVDLTEAPKLKWEYSVMAAGILLVALSYLVIFL